MGGGWMSMVLFWGLAVAAIVAVLVAVTRKAAGGDRPGASAMDILKKRYAKGEITKEEYDSMKKDIAGPRATAVRNTVVQDRDPEGRRSL